MRGDDGVEYLPVGPGSEFAADYANGTDDLSLP